MAFQSTVISSQPQGSGTQYTVSHGLSDWSSNVCDCCEDCGICTWFYVNTQKWTETEKSIPIWRMNSEYVFRLPGLCATFVPCILGCKVAQDNGDSCCVPFLPGAMIALRTSIRGRYNIEVSALKNMRKDGEPARIVWLTTPIMIVTVYSACAFSQGSVCDDWVVMACLPLCGLCQMAREQKMRGWKEGTLHLTVKIAWRANVWIFTFLSLDTISVFEI